MTAWSVSSATSAPGEARRTPIAPGSILERVNSLEPLIHEFRDDEFEHLTADFRRRLGVEHKPFLKKGASEIAVVNDGSPPPPRPPAKHSPPCSA